jgi:subtilisin-like proprotein convertase family protein
MKIRLAAAVLIALAQLSGCGGGGGGGGPSVPTYTIGGTIAGLTGSGLVLRLNGGSNLPVNPNATGFTFTTQLASGAGYAATVLTQPTGPSQTCTVANGTGTVPSANITSIGISCTTNSFTVGGTVSGLTGTGLVLRNNGGNDLAINASGPFTFSIPILSGATYAVTVLTQPTGQVQSCNVASASGTVGAANVTSVGVFCGGFTIGDLSDPLAVQQWHLKNTGQNAFADTVGVAGMDINVEPVYSTFGFTGNGVITAVVDTGLEIAHEDLATNVVLNGSWNFNTNNTDPTNTTVTTGDHGTSVSGLIAMARNTVGGIGVAPSARLKGFNLLSMSPAPTEQAFLDSLGGSTSNPNSSDVSVFNQSFGVSLIDDAQIDPLDEAQYLSGVTNLRAGKGALYVKAAGNGFRGYTDAVSNTPANCAFANAVALSCENANFDPDNTVPYQIVAGAVNASGIKASYSTAGSAIWVSSPGGEFGRNAAQAPGLSAPAYAPAMVTTDQTGCVKGYSSNGTNNGSSFDNGGAPNTSCNYTNGFNGTSSATPVTVGVIALLLEANPALTWRDVKHILASSARQIDAARPAVIVGLSNGSYVAEPGWTTNASGYKFHNWYGFGMVDASAAVNMATTYALGQLGAFANTGFIASPTLSLAIPDNSVTGATNTLPVPATPVHVIEAVQISVTATHPYIGDLGIELTSPSGTRSVLKNIRDGFDSSHDLNGMVLLSNAFYGENPAGSWTIKIVDGNAQDTGTLTNWKIRVFGH